MKFSLVSYRRELVAPITTAYGVIDHREGIHFSVSDAGYVGWGDLCPLPGWSSHGLVDLRARLTAVVSNPTINDREAMLGSLEAMPEARAALAGALADLEAHRAGCSLAASLAERPARSVMVNALVTAVDVEGVRRQAEEAIGQGFHSIKVKVAVADLAADVSRVAAVREVVGDGVEVRLDANGGWNPAQARICLDRLSEFDISFCEEATAGIFAIAALVDSSPIPLGVDESTRTIADIVRALDLGIKVVVIKPQALGGPDFAMQAVGLVTAAGGTSIITTMIDSAVGVAHALHVAAAIGSDQAHGLATAGYFRGHGDEGLTMVDGCLSVPSRPGLGVGPTLRV